MTSPPKWNLEADYFTFCNCAFGCPCNFNARPTEGHCHGGGVWHITKGRFGETDLAGAKAALFYWFPGLIENGNGTARGYIDRGATPAQQAALEAIFSGKAGGGIFEVFHSLTSKWYPTVITDVAFALKGEGKAWMKVGDLMEGECDLLSYPDGMVIKPTFTLPHGIEFKTALATNAKWWVEDEDMLARHTNVYGAIAKVKFDETGCVG